MFQRREERRFRPDRSTIDRLLRGVPPEVTIGSNG
jgi:hypothetical protein